MSWGRRFIDDLKAVPVFIVVVGGGYFLFEAVTNRLFYTAVEGRVVEVLTDCHVHSSKRYIVVTQTGERAFMTCDLAKERAAQFDYQASAVKRRTRVRYTYRSPVDGAEHEGVALWSEDGEPAPALGTAIDVWAHDEEAAKSHYADEPLPYYD